MSIKEFVKKAKKPCEAIIALAEDYRSVMDKEDKTVAKELHKLADAAIKVKKYVDSHTKSPPVPILFEIKEEVAEKLGLSVEEQYTREQIRKSVAKFLLESGMYNATDKVYKVDEDTKELFGFVKCEFKKLSMQSILTTVSQKN